MKGLFADDVELFDGPYDLPTFNFNSLLDLGEGQCLHGDGTLVRSAIRQAYAVQLGRGWRDAWRVFVEDSWKLKRNRDQ